MTADAATSHATEELLELLYLCPVGIAKLDAYGTIELLNPYAVRMLMPLVPGGQLTNLFSLFETFAPEVGEMARRFAGPIGKICEDLRVALPPGPHQSVATLSLTLQKVDGASYIAVFSDATAAAERDRLVLESEERMHAMLDGVKDYSICTVDATGIVTSWNRGAQRLDDYRGDEAIGRHMDFLVATTGSKSSLTRCLEIAARDGSHDFEGWRVRRDGKRYWANTAIGALGSKAGMVSIGFSVITQDLTERRRTQDRLRLLAQTDPLTGVLNRGSFFEEARRLATHPGGFAVLVLDVDNFKSLNDAFGHDAGDDTPRRIVADCRAEIRAGDVFGRIGGEEFAILLPSASAPSGFTVAERIRNRIEQSGTQLGAQACTVSIGVAASATPGTTLEELIKHADRALYAAKAEGRNRVVVSAAGPV